MLEPRPEQITGLQTARQRKNRVLPRYAKDMVATSTHIGFFPKGALPSDTNKSFKHIVPMNEPHRCGKCGDYMIQKRGSSDKFRCVGKCMDKKAEGFILDMQKKYNNNRKPHRSKSISTERLPLL